MTPRHAPSRLTIESAALPPARGRILYVQYTNPGGYPPLEHSAHLLAAQGFDIVMLGLDNHKEDLVIAPHPRIQVRLMPAESAGWRQKIHYARFLLRALWWTLRWRPDWVYASDPLSCPAALLARVAGAANIIYHEHDSPAPPAARDSRVARLVRFARSRVASRADACVLPNAERAEVFRAETGRASVLTVWNTPTVEEVSGPREVRPASVLRVLYHGSVVPSRLPLTVIDALAQLPNGVTLSVVGYETLGHPGYLQALEQRAQSLGILDRLTIVGVIDGRPELIRHCRSCDVGLSLMPRSSDDLNLRAMVGASNKPFDYMACGLPLLVTELVDWRRTYVDGGFGLACDPESPDSIATALRWFMEHPLESKEMGERGRDRIATAWNYQAAFAPVMERIVAGTAPHPRAGAPAVELAR